MLFSGIIVVINDAFICKHSLESLNLSIFISKISLHRSDLRFLVSQSLCLLLEPLVLYCLLTQEIVAFASFMGTDRNSEPKKTQTSPHLMSVMVRVSVRHLKVNE